MDRRTVLAGLGSGIVGIAPALAQAQERTARQLAEQFAATLSAHDIDAFAALFDDGYVNHQRSAAVAPPPAGLSPKQASVGIFAARRRRDRRAALVIDVAVVEQRREGDRKSVV